MMKWSRVRRPALLLGVAALLVGPSEGTARAEVFRASVVVQRPTGMPRRLADLEVDAAARKALAEDFVSNRMSPTLLKLRGSQVRLALEPVSKLIDGFTVVTREDVGDTQVRVVCEGEVDAAAIVLRLVEGRVLTFGQAPPRVLIMPTATTRPDVVQALRARMTDTLGSAGITLLAAEATSAAGGGPALDHAAVIRAAVESRADFVAVVAFSATPAPAPFGAVIDGTLQYTLMRPHDAAIVGEQSFSERGSGASENLASRSVLDALAPALARAMAGRLSEVIFAGGTVVEPDAGPANVVVNVFSRPDAAATSALVTLLRDRGFTVSMAAGRVGGAPSSRTPADQLIVDGAAASGDLYDLLATSRFGAGAVLRAAIVEYSTGYVGLEILDRTQPSAPPVVAQPAPGSPQPTKVTPVPVSPLPGAVPERRRTEPSAGSTATLTADARPLEFRLSAVFASRAGVNSQVR